MGTMGNQILGTRIIIGDRGLGSAIVRIDDRLVRLQPNSRCINSIFVIPVLLDPIPFVDV